MKNQIVIVLASLFFSTIAFASPQIPSSCKSCTPTTDNSLTCLCKNHKNGFNYTKIFMSHNCEQLVNADGNLKCIYGNEPDYDDESFDVNAGPLFNQNEAETKCPVVCRSNRANWTGNWTTIPGGGTSVCGCTYN